MVWLYDACEINKIAENYNGVLCDRSVYLEILLQKSYKSLGKASHGWCEIWGHIVPLCIVES